MSKNWRLTHRREVAATYKAWYKKNTERIKKRMAAWYLKNRDKVLFRTKMWTCKNLEKRNARQAQWLVDWEARTGLKYCSYRKYVKHLGLTIEEAKKKVQIGKANQKKLLVNKNKQRSRK